MIAAPHDNNSHAHAQGLARACALERRRRTQAEAALERGVPTRMRGRRFAGTARGAPADLQAEGWCRRTQHAPVGAPGTATAEAHSAALPRGGGPDCLRPSAVCPDALVVRLGSLPSEALAHAKCAQTPPQLGWNGFSDTKVTCILVGVKSVQCIGIVLALV